MKQPTIPALKKKADKAMSAWVLYIARGAKCPICNRNDVQCNSHLIRRGRSLTRWYSPNTYASCMGCNLYENFHPDVSRAWYIRKYGVEQYLNIVDMSMEKFVPDRKYLNEIINSYKKLLEAARRGL